VAITVLWPVLKKFLPDYPDIHVELSIDSSATDIVKERFDAGVRLGEALAKGMVAVRIGPELRMSVVGSLACFAGRPAPRARHMIWRTTTASTCAPEPAAAFSGVRLARGCVEGSTPIEPTLRIFVLRRPPCAGP
jgi:DNA-binding transcriptional LysR family regulator